MKYGTLFGVRTGADLIDKVGIGDNCLKIHIRGGCGRTESGGLRY